MYRSDFFASNSKKCITNYRLHFFEQWNWLSDIYTVKVDGEVKTSIVAEVFTDEDEEIEELIENARKEVESYLEGPYLEFYCDNSKTVEFVSMVKVMG